MGHNQVWRLFLSIAYMRCRHYLIHRPTWRILQHQKLQLLFNKQHYLMGSQCGANGQSQALAPTISTSISSIDKDESSKQKNYHQLLQWPMPHFCPNRLPWKKRVILNHCLLCKRKSWVCRRIMRSSWMRSGRVPGWCYKKLLRYFVLMLTLQIAVLLERGN